MFVEVTVNAAGEIQQGWCADTPPVQPGEPLYRQHGGDPAGTRRVRLELTTTEWLQIDEYAKEIAATAARALIEQSEAEAAGQELAHWKQHRLAVIQARYVVDMTRAIPLEGSRVRVPAGTDFRRLTPRARG